MMRPLTRQILGQCAAFIRTTRASVVVEAMIVLPALMLVMVGFHTFWHVTQTNNALQKAAFTGADLIAREMVPVNDAYIDGLGKVVDYLARARGATQLRVSSIVRVSGTPSSTTGLSVVWSYSPGNRIAALTNGTLSQVMAALPDMTVGYNVVLVEALMPYRPIANIGLSPMTLRATVAVAPRYVPIICKADLPCSLNGKGS